MILRGAPGLLTLTLICAVLSGCASKPPARKTGGNGAPQAQSAPSYTPAAVSATPSIATGQGVGGFDSPQIYAESAILIDARTGRVLWSKNADSQRPVASTQKLLTALLIVERGNLSQPITIHPEDTMVEPTKLGVSAGDRYTRETLLGTIMVKSCNDAASALARDHSGSLYSFSVAMNRKAYELGARSSAFHNPHGLPDPGQFSTARDIARVSFAAYRSPTLRKYMRTRYYQVTLNNGRVKSLEATNKLLGRSTLFNGMKTGYTNAAGRCLVSSAASGGREVILVQLGSKTSYIFDDAERMMRWGLQAGYRPSLASTGP